MATLDGVGAAREIERLSQEHLAYRWMCGGVNVNHHTLSDFRNLSSDLLNGLLTQTVGALLSEGLVEMSRVAHDGMKVRAAAGGSSFRRRARLEMFKQLAREQIELLTKEIEDQSGAGNQREQSARKRAAWPSAIAVTCDLYASASCCIRAPAPCATGMMLLAYACDSLMARS